MDDYKMENVRPTVSICCITYNHAPYIRSALDGFLMQETDFAYEILIHDDASTDGTADIIREYTARYPDIIKPILREENQYSKGISNISIFNFPRARGEFIAMCEGDDYWTDPHKLQKQVDYLRAHPDCALCFHSSHKRGRLHGRRDDAALQGKQEGGAGGNRGQIHGISHGVPCIPGQDCKDAA